MREPVLAPQFVDMDQQHLSASLGMWVFLAGEIMLFGGLFAAYTVYRVLHPHDFVLASQRLYESIGTANTAILLTSSLTMALAVRSASRAGPAAARWLWITAALGVGFLALKAVEYRLDYLDGLVPGAGFHPPQAAARGPSEMFMVLYFIMTGVHAVHVTSGILVISALAVIARARGPGRLSHLIEMTGLYWHLVDIIWIFLLPLLYLVQ